MSQRDDFPVSFPELTVDGFRLRDWVDEDVAPYFSWANNADILQNFGTPPLPNVEEAGKRIQVFKEQFVQKKGVFWSVVDTRTNQNMGRCQLTDWNTADHRAAIGYLISRAYWNQGIMTRIVREVVRYSFETTILNRIEGWVTTGNVASSRVLEKAGFQYEGLLREYERFNDEYESLWVYAVLRRDWLNLNSMTRIE
ncbi:MAG: GNAT family protein [Chloroflexota bacterium]